MKLEGEIKVTFDDNGDVKNIAFPKETDHFPPKQEWKEHLLWETYGKDNKMKPLTQKAIKNLDDVCDQFAKKGFVGCKKAGKRKLTAVRYVICTSLGGYEFVKG